MKNLIIIALTFFTTTIYATTIFSGSLNRSVSLTLPDRNYTYALVNCENAATLTIVRRDNASVQFDIPAGLSCEHIKAKIVLSGAVDETTEEEISVRLILDLNQLMLRQIQVFQGGAERQDNLQ